MKVSVCVPAYRADTVACPITSIQRQSYTDWELLVVGQGSMNSPRARRVRKIALDKAAGDNRLKYIHLQEKGATRALNAGIKEACGDVIAILDDDCKAHIHWLRTIVEYLEQYPDIGVVGGAVIPPKKQNKGLAVCPSNYPAETVYDPGNANGIPPQGWEWISANLALRRDVVAKVGSFDEHLGPGAYFPAADDTDYKLRLEALKVKMLTTPHVLVFHEHGFRYGWRAVVNHLYNYTFGNGALAAKLTLMGDKRGASWRRKDMRARLLGWLYPPRPHRFLPGILGWLIFNRAYHECLANFIVKNDLLLPKNA